MWGKNAEQFVQGHGNHTFGQETPWGTMWREGFKQMFLGTWFNSCTAIHIAEDWLSLPYMAPELPVWLKDGDGRKEGTVTGSPWGSRDFYNRWGGKVANQLWVKDRHLFRVVTHGRCTILTESFRDLVSTVIDYHYDDPLLLLKDPKEDPFAAKYAEATIAAMEGRERGDWIGPDLE